MRPNDREQAAAEENRLRHGIRKHRNCAKAGFGPSWRRPRQEGGWQGNGWHVEIGTSTRLGATATEFLIDTDNEAREDGVSVFARSWRQRVAREGV